MDQNEERFDKIENYLRGKMSPAEVAAFEQAIAADPALEEEVAMQRFEQDALELLVEDSIRANLKNWKEMPPPAPPASGGSGNRRWWLWGSLLLLIGITTWFILPKNEHTPYNPIQPATNPRDTANNKPAVATDDTQKLPEEKIIPQENTPPRNTTNRGRELLAIATESYNLPQELNLRSAGQTEKSPLDSAITAFAAKDYKKAIVELRPLTPEIGEDYYDRAQEILGHAYYLDKQYHNAAQIFEKMANDPVYVSVRQYGEWYLTLSLLSDYETEKARVDALLKSMTENPRHKYHKDAIKLQGKLQRIK